MDADAKAEKERLRRRLLDARAALSPERRDRAGSALRDAAAEVPELATAGTVAVYYSVEEEPDTRKLVTMLWKRGAYVLLPVFLPDRSLDWAAYDGPESVAPARFGLLEPTGPRYGADAVARASVVLAPALAVDRAGLRLGRGAGCYDRALSLVGPNTLTLGVIYDTEFVDAVPAEPHDRPVDGVLTPQGGLRRL